MSQTYFHWDGKKIGNLLTNLNSRTRFQSFGWECISGGMKFCLREGLSHNNTLYKFKWD